MAYGRTIGLFSIGNRKLGKQTIIFNLSSATNCPSRKRGMCEYADICYAKKAERTWPRVLPFRERQHAWWRETDWKEIYEFMKPLIKMYGIKYFRFNEAGDFEDKEDIAKLNRIAIALQTALGTITYGYTRRYDLNFSGVKFIVRGSNWKGPNGMTTIIKSDEPIPEGYQLCPGDKCGVACTECMIPNSNVAFHQH